MPLLVAPLLGSWPCDCGTLNNTTAMFTLGISHEFFQVISGSLPRGVYSLVMYSTFAAVGSCWLASKWLLWTWANIWQQVRYLILLCTFTDMWINMCSIRKFNTYQLGNGNPHRSNSMGIPMTKAEEEEGPVLLYGFFLVSREIDLFYIHPEADWI